MTTKKAPNKHWKKLSRENTGGDVMITTYQHRETGYVARVGSDSIYIYKTLYSALRPEKGLCLASESYSIRPNIRTLEGFWYRFVAGRIPLACEKNTRI